MNNPSTSKMNLRENSERSNLFMDFTKSSKDQNNYKSYSMENFNFCLETNTKNTKNNEEENKPNEPNTKKFIIKVKMNNDEKNSNFSKERQLCGRSPLIQQKLEQQKEREKNSNIVIVPPTKKVRDFIYTMLKWDLEHKE